MVLESSFYPNCDFSANTSKTKQKKREKHASIDIWKCIKQCFKSVRVEVSRKRQIQMHALYEYIHTCEHTYGVEDMERI